MGKKCLLIAGIILLICIAAVTADTLYFSDRAYPGITIGQTDVSFFNEQQIQEALESTGLEQQVVVFKYPDGEENYSLKDLGIRVDIECLTEKALHTARQGNLLENIEKRIQIFRSGKKIPFCFEMNDSKIKSLLDRMSEDIMVEPVDAEFDVQGDDISIISGKNGIELDQKKSMDTFTEFLVTLNEVKSPVEFPIIVKEVKPETTTQCLQDMKITNLLVKFDTSFNQNDTNRSHNIKLASGLINFTILAPDEVFSFNQVVGRATAERGFKEASVIVSGQFVPGIGGGICQVSSTLYNAALLSSMEIVERSNHGRTVGYLPLGRDATISYGYLDFKFKNTRSHPVLISSKVDGNKMVVRIFGNPVPEERVEIVTSDVVKVQPEVKTEINKNLKPGEKKLVQSGSPGYRVTVWRIIYQGDEEIHRERLSRDYYKPAPALYHVGPQKQEQPASVPKQSEDSSRVEEEVEEEEVVEEEKEIEEEPAA